MNYTGKHVLVLGLGESGLAIALWLARCGATLQVAGNISPWALDVLRAELDEETLPHVWVLELSSFQLHTTYSLQADAATVLNLTQDHLDWHGDMAAYAADKARIFGENTVRVLNRDDALVMQFANATSVTFGVDEPDRADCFGLTNENGMQWLAVAVELAEEGEKKRGKKHEVEVLPIVIKRLMPADALR